MTTFADLDKKNSERVKEVIEYAIAKDMYNSGVNSLMRFALKHYPELKVDTLPKTWTEYAVGYGHNEKEISFAKKQQEEAVPILAKLSHLVNIYNDYWEPDWSNDLIIKYVIFFSFEHARKSESINERKFLAFKTMELRDMFFDNFRDLIESAKPLL